MKVSKAIEILDAIIETGEYEGEPLDTPAIRIGIEALKFLERMRINYPQFPYTPLPGETPEEEVNHVSV